MDEAGTEIEIEDPQNTTEIENDGQTSQEILEPVEHSQVLTDGLQEVIAKYGEADWQQTYAGQESWKFNAENGVLEEVMPDGQTVNLTERINASATPEQQAKHAEILAAWKNGQAGFSEWREKTDRGEVLHVTVLTLRDNEVISETFSRAIEPDEIQISEPGSDDWIQFLQTETSESEDDPLEMMDEKPDAIIDLNLFFARETAVAAEGEDVEPAEGEDVEPAEGEDVEQPEMQEVKSRSELQPIIIAEKITRPTTYPIFVERRSVEFKPEVAPIEPEPIGISLVFEDDQADESAGSKVGQEIVAGSVIEEKIRDRQIETLAVKTIASALEPAQEVEKIVIEDFEATETASMPDSIEMPAIMIEQVIDRGEKFAQPEPDPVEIEATMAEPNMEPAQSDSALIFDTQAAAEITFEIEPLAEKMVIAEQPAKSVEQVRIVPQQTTAMEPIQRVEKEIKPAARPQTETAVVQASEPTRELGTIKPAEPGQPTIPRIEQTAARPAFERPASPRIERGVSAPVEFKSEEVFRPAQAATVIDQSRQVESRRIAVPLERSQATLIKQTEPAAKSVEQVRIVPQQTTAMEPIQRVEKEIKPAARPQTETAVVQASEPTRELGTIKPAEPGQPTIPRIEQTAARPAFERPASPRIERVEPIFESSQPAARIPEIISDETNSDSRPTVIYNAKDAAEAVQSPIIPSNSDNPRLARNNETLNPARGAIGSSPKNLNAPDEESIQFELEQQAA